MARKTRDRKRQTKINFSPVLSSPSKPIALPSPKTAPVTSPESQEPVSSRASRKSSKKATNSADTFSSREHELASASVRPNMPVTSTDYGIFGSSDLDDRTSDTSDCKEGRTASRLKSSSRRRCARESSGSTDCASATVIQTKRKRRQSSDSDEESDGDQVCVSRSKRRKTEKHRARTKEEKKENCNRSVSPYVQKKANRNVSKIEQFDDDEEEDEAPTNGRRHRSTKRRSNSDSEQEDAGNDFDKEDTDSEQEDLKEDLAFLRSSPLPDRGKLRSTHEKPKSDRQKALEALKQRRASQHGPPSSATSGRSRRIIVDSDSESGSDLQIIKEEQESSEGEAPVSDEEEYVSDREANALDMFQEDNDDDGFIDDDPDAVVDEPLSHEEMMPLVAARLSVKKPKDLFTYAIEWMVMKKIHPGFDSRSEVYNITFRKLEDEVKGLANSKFSSSSWTSEFTQAIRRRPDLMISEIPKATRDVMEAHCQACNRRNHPASDELILTGRPYHSETLEPLGNDSESENSDSTTDNSSLSADSEVQPNGETNDDDKGQRFTLGSTCKANAHLAHTLHHWRYHLYSWVKDYLAREGHLTAEQIVRRDKWSDRKRDKTARKIIKTMEGTGEIRKLYRLYKQQIEYAAEARHDQNRWRSR